MRTRSTKQAETARLDRYEAEKKRLVIPELVEVLELHDVSFAQSLYHNLACESAIDTFLKRTRSYSLTQRRWKLPWSYTKLLDRDCYTPLFTVMCSIVKYFWSDAVAQGTRTVVDTHAIHIQHSRIDSPAHNSRPSFVIKAEGPSFQLPDTVPGKKSPTIGFSNIASCIEIQVDGAESISEQLVRIAIYARYVECCGFSK